MKNQDSSATKAGGTDNVMLDKRLPGLVMESIGGADFDAGVRWNATARDCREADPSQITIRTDEMSNFENSLFYQDNYISRNILEHGIEYKISCIDGFGTMVCHEVFPGLELFYNRFQAYHCMENREQSNMLELNFCAVGRFECLSICSPSNSIGCAQEGQNANMFLGNFMKMGQVMILLISD